VKEPAASQETAEASSTESSRWAVVTVGLAKTFGPKRAVDGVDLRVVRGSICGLLGPNGAGKTTLVRMLATLLKPDAGRARVLGHDIVDGAREVRRRIALTGQFASVDEDLTGHENLVLLSRLLGLPRRAAKLRAEELLGTFHLEEVARREVKTYSGGLRRRLDIAASMLQIPDLLFLDEPTTGLDPRSRNQVWDMIRALVTRGTTVLLTTQYLEEADRLADRIAVMDDGRLIAEGTSAELKASVGGGYVHVRLSDPMALEAALAVANQTLGTEVRRGADPKTLVGKLGDVAQAARLLGRLAEAGITVDDFTIGRPSLDEVFFALTGRPAEAEPERETRGAP
jgi:ABC-2 type transport system ATP-binding protein